jgi:hypothetical protein
VIALLLLVFGILVWQSIAWVKNAPEPKMATYAPLQLSDGEKEDVDRIVTKLWTAQKDKALFDEYVSPEVFNGVMEKIIEGERKKNNKTDQPAYFRGGFSGNDYELKVTMPVTDASTKETQYFNVDIIFDCEIEDGKFKQLELKQFLMHDQPPPLFARLYINTIVKAVQQGSTQASVQQGQNQKNPFDELKFIKQIKREGNKVHFVLDGAKMKPPEPAARTTATPAPDTRPHKMKTPGDEDAQPKLKADDTPDEKDEKPADKEKQD